MRQTWLSYSVRWVSPRTWPRGCSRSRTFRVEWWTNSSLLPQICRCLRFQWVIPGPWWWDQTHLETDPLHKCPPTTCSQEATCRSQWVPEWCTEWADPGEFRHTLWCTPWCRWEDRPAGFTPPIRPWSSTRQTRTLLRSILAASATRKSTTTTKRSSARAAATFGSIGRVQDWARLPIYSWRRRFMPSGFATNACPLATFLSSRWSLEQSYLFLSLFIMVQELLFWILIIFLYNNLELFICHLFDGLTLNMPLSMQHS